MILNIFVPPGPVIDALIDMWDAAALIRMFLLDSEVWVIEGFTEVMMDTLSDVMIGIMVAAAAVIDLEFAVTAAYDLDVLTGV